jgi:hypothetical protein
MTEERCIRLISRQQEFINLIELPSDPEDRKW